MKTIFFTLILILPLIGSSQEVLIEITNPQVSGDQVTYDVTATDFVDVVAYQFEIGYDPQILTFSAIQNPHLTYDSFSFQTDNPGSIINLWTDLSLDGVTLPDSTIMYQIVFDMVNDTFGSVCFNQDSTPFEVIDFNNMFTVYITDDCHEEPFLFVDNTSGTEDIAYSYGLKVSSVNFSSEFMFSLEKESVMSFRLFNMTGAQLASFPSDTYSPGVHMFDIPRDLMPGMYILTAVIDQQPVSLKVIFL